MHFVIVGALPQSLVNFRGDLIRDALNRGHRVTAMSSPATPEEIVNIEATGAVFHSFPVQRTGLNPLSDIKTLRTLRQIFSDLQPDIVLAYTIKPVVWSGIALSTLRTTCRFYGLITGLGYAFEGRGFAHGILRFLVTRLYRQALRRAEAVIFQNPDNRDIFVRNKIVSANHCCIVNGSGVDTVRFTSTRLPTEGQRFLLIARLLGDKGLREYAEAAAIVKTRHPDAEFHLVGPTDPSPDGIPLSVIEGWHKDGRIIYHGPAKDVRPYIANCHVYVLPSYHEGMPRSVLEAMSMGRPILTTDVTGCRQTVVPGLNGWLVPRQDAKSLAQRMNWFLENPSQWPKMGEESRRMALETFDVRIINAQMLDIIESPFKGSRLDA